MKREEILKIAKPILFNQEMVQAILEGRKTVTRRVVKPQPSSKGKLTVSEIGLPRVVDDSRGEMWTLSNAPYQVGDILYVRETWTTIDEFENYADLEIDKDLRYLYKCDDNGKEHTFIDVGVKKWKPSIHMPKSVARIFLKVTDIRVERLKEMTLTDLIKEGIWVKGESIPANKFIELWNSTIKKQNLDKYSWEANPWLWVIEFERADVE